MLTLNIALACLVSFCVAEDSFIGFQWSDQTLHAVAEDSPTIVGPIFGQTDWGDWKSDIRCPGNVPLIGFKLELDNDAPLDHVGVTGIQLICKNGNQPQVLGASGHVMGDHVCPRGKYISKISAQSVKYDPILFLADDVGIANIRATCTDNSVINGEGLNEGVWDVDKGCQGEGSYTRICGVKPKIDMNKPGLFSPGSTGMNKLQLVCCKKAGGGGDRTRGRGRNGDETMDDDEDFE